MFKIFNIFFLEIIDDFKNLVVSYASQIKKKNY